MSYNKLHTVEYKYVTDDERTFAEREEKPGYKDPHIEHHYPSRTVLETFQQYFLLAAKMNNGISELKVKLITTNPGHYLKAHSS